MQTTTLDLSADIIDVRDIIARVEELEAEIKSNENVYVSENEAAAIDESEMLQSILAQLVGYGGDEEWRGDWYPVTLIDDSHFTDYARELLEECGTIPRDLPSWVEIDWDATARNVRMDYTPVDIDGRTYWYR